MITRYFDGEVPYPSEAPRPLNPSAFVEKESALKQQAENTIQQFNEKFDRFDFSGALKELWFFIAGVDGYIARGHIRGRWPRRKTLTRARNWQPFCIPRRRRCAS